MPRTTANQLPAFDLKAEREKRKLSQKALAEKLYQSQGTVSRWEINGQTPALAREYWKLICDIEDKKLVYVEEPNTIDAGALKPKTHKKLKNERKG